MKCLKMNQCKPKPMVGTQKGSIPIKVPIFLLGALIMLSMATVAIAQSQAVAQGPTTSLEEDYIMNNFTFRDYDANFTTRLYHYMRDGCKKALAGDWVWPATRDIITITYDEQYKVFLGTLTRPGPGKIRMDLPVGHLLFKVYFFQENRGVSIPDFIDINWLREQQQCRNWMFKGEEYSFEERTRKKTQMTLMLILNGDQLQYKLDKNAWNLTRFR